MKILKRVANTLFFYKLKLKEKIYHLLTTILPNNKTLYTYSVHIPTENIWLHTAVLQTQNYTNVAKCKVKCR